MELFFPAAVFGTRRIECIVSWRPVDLASHTGDYTFSCQLRDLFGRSECTYGFGWLTILRPEQFVRTPTDPMAIFFRM